MVPIFTYNHLEHCTNGYLQDKFHEAVVNLTQQRIESHARLGPNIHSPGDGEEIILIEKVALEDEGVKAEIAKLQLPEGTVVISDPWIYGMPDTQFRMWG